MQAQTPLPWRQASTVAQPTSSLLLVPVCHCSQPLSLSCSQLSWQPLSCTVTVEPRYHLPFPCLFLFHLHQPTLHLHWTKTTRPTSSRHKTKMDSHHGPPPQINHHFWFFFWVRVAHIDGYSTTSCHTLMGSNVSPGSRDRHHHYNIRATFPKLGYLTSWPTVLDMRWGPSVTSHVSNPVGPLKSTGALVQFSFHLENEKEQRWFCT